MISKKVIFILLMTFDIVWGLMLRCDYVMGWTGEYSDYDYGDDEVKDEWLTICELHNVRILQKDRQQFIDVAGTFEQNSRIVEVKIFDSTIEYVPEELKFKFPNLKKLFINGCNNLPEIDNSFFETTFEKLDYLTIMRNKFSHYPVEHKAIKANPFEKLPNLKVFNLNEKMIEILSENTFKGSKKLREISLFTNRIEVVPSTLFRNLRNLEIVDLGSNHITSLDADLFKDNLKLKSVYFISNKIETIPDKLFRNLASLTDVDFSYNRISLLNANLFKTNKNLEIINFRINKIDRIEPDSFRNLRKIKEVDFYANDCISKTIEMDDDCDSSDLDASLKNCYQSWSNNFISKQNNTKYIKDSSSGILD